MYTAKFKVMVDIPREPTKEEKKVEPDVETLYESLEVEIALKSENRNYMRNLELLCKENKLLCETVVEVTPRPVKFKGVE